MRLRELKKSGAMDYSLPNLSGKEKTEFFLAIVAAGLCVGLLFYNSLRVSAIVSALCFLVYPKYQDAAVKRHQDTLLVQFKDLLYSISASVSSGRSMPEALSEAEKFCGASYEDSDYIMQELAHMNAMLANGNETDTEVLYDFARRSGLPDVEDFAGAYESCKTSGANLNNAISTATALIGDKIELEDELRTQLAQKLFEGRIVGLSPFAIVLMVRVTAPDYISPMFETRQGLVITTMALALIAASIFMTERINKIEI